MSTIVVDSQTIRIPPWVTEFDSFRRWAQSDEFSESGRICFLDGDVWVDMSKEQIFSHNQVKGEYAIVLGSLVKRHRLGRYFPDGVLLANADARLVSQPDGVFVSTVSLSSGKVRLVEGSEGGYVELDDTPDMVLEVVSNSSVGKDTRVLRDLYWQATVTEYWLVDARGQPPEFNILRQTANGYVSVRKRSGWLKSGVFGKSFRLVCEQDSLGHPDFTLEMR